MSHSIEERTKWQRTMQSRLDGFFAKRTKVSRPESGDSSLTDYETSATPTADPPSEEAVDIGLAEQRDYPPSEETLDIGLAEQRDCAAECCEHDLARPYHPAIDFSSSRKRQGKQTRAFSSKWFNEHNWLTFCNTRNTVFCFYCRKASPAVFKNTKVEPCFTSDGFGNWKKAKARFREHESSQAHQQALRSYQASTHGSVVSLLSSQLRKDQSERRKMLMTLLTSLRYLARQGIAIRGHIEEEGNLLQLLSCRAEDVPGLKAWLKDPAYKSHDVINELIQLMYMQVLRKLLTEIRSAAWYAIIADETRDLSGGEQFAISVRWVDTDYNIYEDLIGLVEVESTTAENLSSVIKDTLLRSVLPLSQCRGQAYDGASNMAGSITGVAKRLQEDEPAAIFVHCLAHSLNLCLQDCARQCSVVREALDLTSGLATLIRASPKRLAIFKHLQEDLAPTSPGLKPLCPTRWTVRTGALQSILKNYVVIRSELELLSQETDRDVSTNASGYLALMERFDTFFGLQLSHLVFSATEQLSRTLQNHDINAQDVSMATSQLVSFLSRQRSDAAFSEFYRTTVDKAKDLTEPPKLPRQRRIPRRLDDGCPNHTFSSPESFFRQRYFQIFDLLINELKRRFNQPSFGILKEIENLLLKSCNDIAVQPSENFASMYAKDINLDKLKIQLCMLPDLLRTANEEHQLGVKKVTTIGTIVQLLNTCSYSKMMLREVDRLVRIFLTIPMASATAERSFSALRRLKNYLRTTMSQKRLNHLIVLHVHKDRTGDLQLSDVARQFVSMNERRKNYFGCWDT